MKQIPGTQFRETKRTREITGFAKNRIQWLRRQRELRQRRRG